MSHRGGALSTAYGQLATIDPAAATAEDLPPTELLGLINDGLVTLNHVPGPAGTRLVPDLALALPEPTDRGRTFRFRLRPGIRYSTGALVRPSDVTHSFERLFQLGGAGAPYYQAISGAAACRRSPASCDLSRGIVADDRAGTVTFHLTLAGSGFPVQAGHGLCYVLPATVPGREARAPLPATGPYMISRYVPGRELLMVRNPRFREMVGRGAASREPGHQIRIRLDLGGARAAAAVADGRSDFLPSIGHPVRCSLPPALPQPAPDQPGADHRFPVPQSERAPRSPTCMCVKLSTWPWTAVAPWLTRAGRSGPARLSDPPPA